MDLNHLHLNSPNVEGSVEFYKNYFGFSRAQKRGAGAYFLYNEHGFMLAIDELPSKEVLPKWLHYGFRLDSKDDVQKVYSRLVEAGHEITKELTSYDDWTMFRCKEPAGYEIEVYWEPV